MNEHASTPTLEHQLGEKVNKYRHVTQTALSKVRIAAKENTKEYTIAMDFLTMSNNYFNDAIHFQEQGQLLLALAAFSYAHAWMDAGVRSGILDGLHDDVLFTLP